jgi:hypothetical protein
MSLIKYSKANLPNLRRLFVEARTDAEESAYSRAAVRAHGPNLTDQYLFFTVLQYRSFHVFCRCFQLGRSKNEQGQLLSTAHSVVGVTISSSGECIS